MITGDKQWMRQTSLKIAGLKQALDLSAMHFRFSTTASHYEAPNTLAVRVYNLSDETIKAITKKDPVEYTLVELKAGYQGNLFGTIFAGQIKQYRFGKENNTDRYLDILAAESDAEYNDAWLAETAPAGTPRHEVLSRIAAGMGLETDQIGNTNIGGAYSANARGKVMWGLGRVQARNLANTMGCGWSMQKGKLVMLPLDSYLPGEIVVLNSTTGMIGIPEQQEDGIHVRCLLNPKLAIGRRIQIDNTSINQTVQGGALSQNSGIGQFIYNAHNAMVTYADVTNDGYYMMYSIEHRGDTRGTEWYSDIVALAMDKKDGKVIAQ